MARARAPSESFGFEGREIPIHEGDTIGSALYRAGDRHRLALLQVPPPPRLPVHERRLPELPRAGRRRDRRALLHAARERRHEGGAAERHVLARARPARDERHEDRAQVPAGRLLLQDADQAALAVAQGRADDPQGRGPRQGRQGRPAPSPRARLPPPRRRRARRRPGRAGRRARRRRGRRVGDRRRRGRAPGLPPRQGRDARRAARAAAAGRGQRAHRAAARAPRVRALRGPRGAADRARPARDDAAEGDRRRDRRVRVDGGLPGQRRAGRDARRAAPCGSRRSTRSSPPTRRVVLAGTHEVGEHVAALQAVGTTVAAVIVPDGATSAPELPDGVRTIVGEIVQAHGKKRVKAVSVRYTGGTEKIECDLLCLSGSFTPQENLLRQGTAMPVHAAGDLLAPAPVAESVAHAREVGARAARGEGAELPELGLKARRCGDGGYVCICEDVSVQDVRNAVTEGFSSTELLKRYTTITMGPCQGRMCHGQMRTLAERLSPGAEPRISSVTTARPPARTVMLDEVTAGAYAHLERRTGAARRPPRPRRDVPVGRPVEARRQLRLDRARVPRGARGRGRHRRRHARQVPRLRARRRRVPRAPLPQPRGRHPARAPALRAAARRARRDPRRRHRSAASTTRPSTSRSRRRAPRRPRR